MPTKIIVNVTAKDIREGRKSDCLRCPVYRAVSRRLGQMKYLRVFTQEVHYRKLRAKLTRTLKLPHHVQDWIYSFDLNGADSVRPIRFTLTLHS